MEMTPHKVLLSKTQQKKIIATVMPDHYVTVSCRLKPLMKGQEKSKIQVDRINHSITISETTKSISKTYGFDQIFQESICQDEFANHLCDPLIQFLKKSGDSGLIFSYGITNSGKTFSILGTVKQPGILLTLIKKLQKQFKDQTIKVVACELYKDQFYSLKNKGERLVPKEFRGTFSFEDCAADIINEENMESLFQSYQNNRSCSSTFQNSVSSRSHAIFKISTSNFKIGVVDLAGSQRYCKNQDNGDIKQTIFINSSLLTLKKCIKALQQKSTSQQKVCVPYRESKLTQALMQYFCPSSKINIIVNINQSKHCLQQNLNVMDYTSKAKNITSNCNSQFALMIKSSQRKYDQMRNALKSMKKPQTISKLSITIQDQQFIITQDQLQDEQTQQFIKQKIFQSQRSKLIRKKMDSQIYRNYYQEAQKFQHYMEIQAQMERKRDQKQIQRFRNMTVWTTKKQIQQNQHDQKNAHDHQEVQYKIDLVSYKEQILKNVRLEDLRTSLKKSLLSQLEKVQQQNQQTQKPNITYTIDVQTCFSTNRKNQFLNNKEHEYNESTNNSSLNMFADFKPMEEYCIDRYSTPSKKSLSPIQKELQNMNQISQQDQCSQVQLPKQTYLQKSIQKSIELFTSGVKIIKSGFSAFNLRSHNLSQKKSHNPSPLQNPFLKEQKYQNFQLINNINFQFKGVKKATVQTMMMTDEEFVRSQKKKYVDKGVGQNKSVSEVAVQTDLQYQEPQIKQKITDHQTIMKIVHDSIRKVKFQAPYNQRDSQLQKSLREAIQEATDKIRKQKKHRGRRAKAQQKKQDKKAFKNFSTKKEVSDYSQYKKKKAYVASSKRLIAKNTRAATRKRTDIKPLDLS